MAITDALILANTAVLAVTFDKFPTNVDDNYYWFYRVIAAILSMLPIVCMACVSHHMSYKVFRSKIIALLNTAKEKLPCCNGLVNRGRQNEDNEVEFNQPAGNFNDDLPNRMLCPQQYMQWGYDSMS